MPLFDGHRIALLESRKSTELATLVRRLGGTPVCVPSVREVLRAGDVGPALARLVADRFQLVVVLTAAACEALLAEAQRSQLKDQAVAALSRTTIAARGPKPLLILRRSGLQPHIVTPRPHTTDDLLAALAPVDLMGRDVLVLHYGERSATFSDALAERGARVEDLSLYDWALPEDMTPLRAVVRDAIDEEIDAVLFTSQVQFRHLLQAAEGIGLDGPLVDALRDRVIVGSIGPVCSRALRAAGIVPDVMPDAPNGPSLITAVAEYLSMFRPTEENAS